MYGSWNFAPQNVSYALTDTIMLLLLEALPFIILATGLVLYICACKRNQLNKAVLITIVVGIIFSALSLIFHDPLDSLFASGPFDRIASPVLYLLPFIILATGLVLYIRARIGKQPSKPALITLIAGVTLSAIPIVTFLVFWLTESNR